MTEIQKCEHSEHVVTDVVYTVCHIGLFNGKPSRQECAGCKSYKGVSRGLGDTVAKIVKKTGIKPCGGCQKRRQKLNKAFAYAKKNNKPTSSE